MQLQATDVQYRIEFKLALLAFNTRSNNAPLYLSCLLHNYVPGRSLRSSQSNLLCVPAYKLILAHVVYSMELTSCRHSCMYILWLFYPSAKTYFNNAFQYAVRPLLTARTSDSMFFCIDYVCVTNCFYDYEYHKPFNKPTVTERKFFTFLGKYSGSF